MKKACLPKCLACVGVTCVLLTAACKQGEAVPNDHAVTKSSEPTAAKTSETEAIRLQITVPFHGSSPGEIEESVAIPIETAIRSIRGVQRIRTMITKSLCQLTLSFGDSTDANDCMSEVRKALDTIGELPANTGPFQLRLLPPTGTLQHWIVWTPVNDDDPMDLMAMQALRERIIQVPHVDDVYIFGTQNPYLDVVLDEDRMRSFGVSWSTIQEAIEHWSVGSQNQSPNTEELETLTLRPRGVDQTLSLRDVAQVRKALQSSSRVRWNGQRCVAVSITPAISGDGSSDRKLEEHLIAGLPGWQQDLAIPGELSTAFSNEGADVRIGFDLPAGNDGEANERIADLALEVLEPLLVDTTWLLIESEEAIELFIGHVPQPDEFVEEARNDLAALPGIGVTVVNLGEPSFPVVASIIGADVKTTGDWAKVVAREAAGISGVIGVRVVGAETLPQVELVPNLDKANRLGVDLPTLRQLISAIPRTGRLPGGNGIPIVVSRGATGVEPDDLSMTTLFLPDGMQVLLSDVADVSISAVPKPLIRVDFQRAVEVHIQADNDIAASLREHLESIFSITRPAGVADEIRYRIDID